MTIAVGEGNTPSPLAAAEETEQSFTSDNSPTGAHGEPITIESVPTLPISPEERGETEYPDENLDGNDLQNSEGIEEIWAGIDQSMQFLEWQRRVEEAERRAGRIDVATSGDRFIRFTTEGNRLIATSGDGDALTLATSGKSSEVSLAIGGDDDPNLKDSGDGDSNITNSGDSDQRNLATSGNKAGENLATSGDGQIVATSDGAKETVATVPQNVIALSNYRQIATSGDGSQVSSKSVPYSEVATSGNGRLATSGDGQKSFSFEFTQVSVNRYAVRIRWWIKRSGETRKTRLPGVDILQYYTPAAAAILRKKDKDIIKDQLRGYYEQKQAELEAAVSRNAVAGH